MLKHCRIIQKIQENRQNRQAEKTANEFLPEALRITQSNSSPFGSALLLSIVLLVGSLLLWSILGQTDEVAIARGKLIPHGRVKIIQSYEEGIITGVYAEEGEKVRKDQVLLELDNTLGQTDKDTLEQTLEAEKTERALLQQLLEGGDPRQEPPQNALDPFTRAHLLELADLRNQQYQGKKRVLELLEQQSQEQLQIARSDKEKLEKELQSAKERERQLEAIAKDPPASARSLPLLEKKIQLMQREETIAKELYENGALAQKNWQEKADLLDLLHRERKSTQEQIRAEEKANYLQVQNAGKERLLLEQERQTQQNREAQAALKCQEAASALENLRIEKDESLVQLLLEKDQRITQLEAQLSKVQTHLHYKTLSAPLDGQVYALTSVSVGSVISPAQRILSIVPEGTPLLLEAYLSNKDIGFVKIGQEVRIKVDTYPFQRYGMWKGHVIFLSPDAIEDEHQGLVYRMKIQLENQESLQCGMSATAEIKTGQRRIIDFFLDPLIQHTNESLKLR